MAAIDCQLCKDRASATVRIWDYQGHSDVHMCSIHTKEALGQYPNVVKIKRRANGSH